MLLHDNEQDYTPFQKEKVKSSTRRNRCPICNGTGCGVNSKIVLCWRVEAGSKEQVKSGAYLHFRNDFISYVPPIIRVMEPKPVIELSPIYESLLDCLVLSDKHQSDLRARGLSDETITRNRYRSTPAKADTRTICQYLESMYSLDEVPGFFMEESRRINVKGSGIFIPYRNVFSKIQGLQIRPDRGTSKYIWFSSSDHWKGASSGTHIHFAGVEHARQTKELYITEGGLKADCIAELSKSGVVAIAGVNATDFNKLMDEIKRQLPEVTTLILAFDVDWKTNPHVKTPLLQLIDVAEKQFKVAIEDWNIKQGKGLDDKLLNDKNK